MFWRDLCCLTRICSIWRALTVYIWQSGDSCDACLGRLPSKVKTSYDFSNKYDAPKIDSLAPYIDYAFFSCREDNTFTRSLLKRVKRTGGRLR